jgi:hypothetical protein
MAGNSAEREVVPMKLSGLIGRALSAVVFVQDYLQLQFDGDLLTVLVWPTVVSGGGRYTFGNPGYRDALCERIAAVVTDAEVEPEQRLTVRLDDGSTIVVPLDPESHTGPEAVIYAAEDGRTWVWG